MGKNKKYISIIGIIIGILVIICICALIYTHVNKHPHIVDVYAYNENESTALTYGMNLDYINNKKWKYASTLFEENSDAASFDGIQVSYAVSETIDQDIDQIIQVYQDQTVWISLVINQDLTKKQLESMYDYIEKKTNSYEYINVVYPIEHALKLYKSRGINWVSQDVRSMEDIDKLENLPQSFKEKVQILVNEYLIEAEGIELTEKLDVISRLYYTIPITMPEVKMVFNQCNLNNAHYRVIELYNQILSESWVSWEQRGTQSSTYQKLDTNNLIALDMTMLKGNGNIQFITSYAQDIEFVEYKVNDKTVKKVSRYPFKLTSSDYDAYNGINKLKVIIKLKEEEDLIVQEYYIDFKQFTEIGERADRATQNYDINDKMQYEKPYIPVLMYHEFKDVVGESESEQSISVSTSLFESHIEALLEEGYTPITFKNLEQCFKQEGGLPAKPIIITTDDGYLSNYTIAYPILQKYNVPATYFITSAYMGVQTTMPHFTWEEARQMEASGLIDIQSHTHAHALLDKLSQGEVMYQASMSFAMIEKELGKRDIKVLAYPQFLHNKKTIKWLQDVGVDLQITNLAKRKGVTEPLNIKRIHVSNAMSQEDLIEEIERLTK